MERPETSFSTQITPSPEKCNNDTPEESGWTTYLDDFSKQGSELSYCSSFATPSLVSDATSRYPGHDMEGAFPDIPSTNLILIKRMRTGPKIVSNEEETLEDTASSPVHHSPKVDEFKSVGMCMKKIDDDQNSVGLLYGKCGNTYYEKVDKRSTEIMFVGRPDYEFTSLKKRRLCLVPLSLLSNIH